ncbi:MAG: phage tail protein [Candidatus Accumulibacter sp.]|jgi:phage protein U|nr:phage tail protein [Accumulibacter sp.]
MYAVLGDIEFDLITYFDGFESRFGADFAEHALIDGKPRLQWVADALDEIGIELTFHRMFCDPEAELARLKSALTAHQAMALVLGNGDYKGWFVLTEAETTARQTDAWGTLVAVEARITLREFVGDKTNPLPPPAVRPDLPPAGARTLGAAASAGNTARLAGTPEFSAIRQAVGLAKQAQAAIDAVGDAARMAQTIAGNPAAAASRAAGLLRSIGQAVKPLEGIAPALSGVSGRIDDAARLVQAGNRALNAMRSAGNALSSADLGNAAAAIAAVSGRVSEAAGAFKAAASATARLAGRIATRSR